MGSAGVQADLATEAQAASIPPTSLAEPASCSSADAAPEQVASRGSDSFSHAESAASSSAAAQPCQVMSGAASSSSNTEVKRPSADCSHSDSETWRIHGDHSTSDVVMPVSDSDVDQSVSPVWNVGRQRGVLLVDVNDWILHHATVCVFWALTEQLQGAPEVVPRGRSCRMSCDSLIYLWRPKS